MRSHGRRRSRRIAANTTSPSQSLSSTCDVLEDSSGCSMMMKLGQAKRAILQEWLARSEAERTGNDAAGFALAAAQDYPFGARGDRYQRIMDWLAPHISTTA